jgi:hypothetical protein
VSHSSMQETEHSLGYSVTLKMNVNLELALSALLPSGPLQ